jgi:hypothetical protein
MRLAPHIGLIFWEALMLGIALRFPDAPVLVSNLIIGGALLGLITWVGWLAIQWRRNQKTQSDTHDIAGSFHA